MAVKYCKKRGMLLSGVVSPESSEKGMISSIEYSNACCMVAATAETNKPMPIAANRNSSRPATSVRYEPAKGMWNHS